MLKKLLTISLAITLVNLVCVLPAAASGQQDEDARHAAKLKARIAKLDIERDTRVEVKLHDGTKVKGYLSAVGENGFSITNLKTNVATSINYDQVKNFSSYHYDWRTGTFGTLLSIGVGVAVILAAIFVRGA